MRKLLLLFTLCAAPLWAVEPGEVLDDPALEARARDISKGLRCLVCQNESIDESHADLARDLRVLVRERLVAGDSNEEAVDFIVARYGEYVLLRPRADGANLILWITGPALFGVALLVGGAFVMGRRKAQTAPETGLSAEEEDRLSQILGD